MAEEILNLLVKIPELKVIGRTSSFQFKGKSDDLRKIGTTLGAAYLVEGSVRRSGDHIRVTAQLIDTRDGSHRWSETFDRNTTDILRLQEEIAANIASSLNLTVSTDVGQRAAATSPRAYDYYLRGLQEMRAGSKEEVERGLAAFRMHWRLTPNSRELRSASQDRILLLALMVGWGRLLVSAVVKLQTLR